PHLYSRLGEVHSHRQPPTLASGRSRPLASMADRGITRKPAEAPVSTVHIQQRRPVRDVMPSRRSERIARNLKRPREAAAGRPAPWHPTRLRSRQRRGSTPSRWPSVERLHPRQQLQHSIPPQRLARFPPRVTASPAYARFQGGIPEQPAARLSSHLP